MIIALGIEQGFTLSMAKDRRALCIGTPGATAAWLESFLRAAPHAHYRAWRGLLWIITANNKGR